MIDKIVALLPAHLVASLQSRSVLRKMILEGKLRSQIQRALNTLDEEALTYFADVCAKWVSTAPYWAVVGPEYPLSRLEPARLPALTGDEALVHEYEEYAFVELQAYDSDDEEDDAWQDAEVEEDEELGGGDGARLWQSPPVIAAIWREQWAAVEFFVGIGFSTCQAVDFACKKAPIETIRLLLSTGHKGVATDYALLNAIGNDDLQLVRRLRSHGPTLTYTAPRPASPWKSSLLQC
ncbi:hypothetical protein BDK51DRAFT_51571 [Blyttiomyces helicus]|uniref:Ankyrin repeat-containing domain protein n=1 Tax=Blyttiomyces helicus TaxID=388810 RepID=A0A4P9W6B3_9FUNG|nr:hypothetical protein BDK51DRAFT_51571 [Blyttiomyces helicus]|eukprot:RKO87991.1 hypothetical protein BDK51DRAFT_51571 [Blyttiomyces helicus]